MRKEINRQIETIAFLSNVLVQENDTTDAIRATLKDIKKAINFLEIDLELEDFANELEEGINAV